MSNLPTAKATRWWRRRELNPRPRKPVVKSLRAYPVQKFRTPLQSRQERRHSSPIGSQPTAPDRSLWPIPQNDAHSPPRGLSGWSGYLIKIRRRMQTAYWQLWFPIVLRELGTRHASLTTIQSRRIRCAPFVKTPDEDTSLWPGKPRDRFKYSMLCCEQPSKCCRSSVPRRPLMWR